MKNFITMLTMLLVSLVLLQGNVPTAEADSEVKDYVENDYDDGDGETDVQYTSFAGLNEYKESHEPPKKEKKLVLAFPLVQKRNAATRKYHFKFCVPRGRNCDHRPKKCCNGGSCRCNLWGVNCKCQRRGFFQKWGK
ncbi:Hypothetical protein CINCED_3A017728 [Cinara cedri]|nr:Hypothetical protein CINCED_3A017728 [Cinara cedri]